MARINTNVASLTAQRGLTKSQRTLNDTLQRLSSGLRINRGADDPAGLIASEGLRSEIAGINQAIDNSSRASNVISTAEGALSEVASLLLNVKDLVVEAANSGALSPEEIKANQLQVDSAVESITRISNTTTFAGLKLLDGSLDYLTSGVNDDRHQGAGHLAGQLRHRDVAAGRDQRDHQRPHGRPGVPRQRGRHVGDARDRRQRRRRRADVHQRHDRLGDRVRGQPHQRLDRRHRRSPRVGTSGSTFHSSGYGTKNFVSVHGAGGHVHHRRPDGRHQAARTSAATRSPPSTARSPSATG